VDRRVEAVRPAVRQRPTRTRELATLLAQLRRPERHTSMVLPPL